MTDESLKPCPFCGGEPTTNYIKPHTHHLAIGDFKMPDYHGGWVIECHGCGCGKISYDSEAEVIEAWNRRAP